MNTPAWCEPWISFCRECASFDEIAAAALDLARAALEHASTKTLRTEGRSTGGSNLIGGLAVDQIVSAGVLPSFFDLARSAASAIAQKPADLRYRAIRQVRARRRIRFDTSWIPTARRLQDWSASGPAGTLDELVSSLAGVLSPHAGNPSEISAGILDTLIAFEELHLSDGVIRLRTTELDRDVFTNRLFGLHTSIKDLDGIFTGGLLFFDAPAPELKGAMEGRTVLVAGPFGSGKSILTGLMAVEVARKGGAALVVLPEQSSEEWLVSLQQMDSDLDPRCIERIDLEHFDPQRKRDPNGRGVVVLAAPKASNADQFMFLNQANITSLAGYPLRLLVVDPVDAFLGRPASNSGEGPESRLSRQRTHELFNFAKQWGVNLLLTTEVESGSVRADHFIENTADTVIHLSRKTTEATVTRSLEVTKSRLQKQLPGPHALLLDEKGLRVYPSFAAIRSIQPKFEKSNPRRISYGVRGFVDLLGSNGLHSSDVVVLAGKGKSKTRFGFEFLCPFQEEGMEEDTDGWSLLITDRNKHDMRHRVTSLFAHSHQHRPRLARFDAWNVRVGYVEAGQLLYDMLEGIEYHRRRNQRVDRLMIHSIARWEEGVAFLKDPGVFGVELLSILRDRGITSVIVSSDSTEYGETALRNVMLDYSDVLVSFNNLQIGGQDRTFIRLLKSGTMEHSRQAMELSADPDGLRMIDAPLVRIRPDGEAEPRQVRFFLFAETQRHKNLNEELLHGIKSFLTHAVDTDGLFRADLPVLRLGGLSVLDELQVVQLDEHQTPSVRSGESELRFHRLPRHLIEELWRDLLIDPARRLGSSGHDALCIVPFYLNVSFLLLSPPVVSSLHKPTWQDIATYSAEFDPARWCDPDGTMPELFFYCPVYEGARETYNCLYLEILRAVRKDADPFNLEGCGPCRLLDFLAAEPAETAAGIFRTICREGHKRYYSRARERTKPDQNENPTHGSRVRAAVTRHWYNTLNQYASEMGEALNAYRVEWMPGETTTAGEWYLGIPITSVSPRTALEFIRDLTSKEREKRRLEEGVGLPTRTEFYRNEGQRITQSPFLNMGELDIPKAFSHAIRRSDFGCYNDVAGTISQHLIWLLEHSTPEAEVVKSLRSDIQLLMNNVRCRGCDTGGAQ